MTEHDLKRTILDHEEELAATAEGSGPEAETCSVLLSWARGEEIDSEKAQRIVERAEGAR